MRKPKYFEFANNNLHFLAAFNVELELERKPTPKPRIIATL
jgi:hypothetical protein